MYYVLCLFPGVKEKWAQNSYETGRKIVRNPELNEIINNLLK